MKKNSVIWEEGDWSQDERVKSNRNYKGNGKHIDKSKQVCVWVCVKIYFGNIKANWYWYNTTNIYKVVEINR